MQTLNIEIHHHDRSLPFDLYNVGVGESLAVGRQVQVADGVHLVWEGSYERRSFGFPSIDLVQAVVTGVEGLPFALLGSYIYDKLKSRKSGIEKLTIGGHQVAVEREDIERLIRNILLDDYEPVESEYDEIRRL